MHHVVSPLYILGTDRANKYAKVQENSACSLFHIDDKRYSIVTGSRDNFAILISSITWLVVLKPLSFCTRKCFTEHCNTLIPRLIFGTPCPIPYYQTLNYCFYRNKIVGT